MHLVISGHLFSCRMWEPPWWASKKMHIRISKLFKNFFPLCTNFFFSLPFPLLPHWLILALPSLQLVKNYKMKYASTYKPFTMTFKICKFSSTLKILKLFWKQFVFLFNFFMFYGCFTTRNGLNLRIRCLLTERVNQL